MSPVPYHPEVEVYPVAGSWWWVASTLVRDDRRSDWRWNYWNRIDAFGFSRGHALRRLEAKVAKDRSEQDRREVIDLTEDGDR